MLLKVQCFLLLFILTYQKSHALNFRRDPILACVPKNITCDPKYLYRSEDGSCNHLEFPWLGKTNTPYSRLFPPKYRDGIHLPRKNLPYARKVRTVLMPDVYIEDVKLTQLFMIFGQVLTHDMMITFDNAAINCCLQKSDEFNFDERCLPIMVPEDDAFYSQFKVKCINLVRHRNTFLTKCTKRHPAEQIGSATSFIDASDIYGNSKSVSRSIRKFQGGKLNTTIIHDMEFLPSSTNNETCKNSERKDFCFLSGDIRVDQNPLLVVLTTTFYILHNKIVVNLAKVNSHWDDEKLYQEGRKIVIAIKQHIVYRFWLPELIGKKFMVARRLLPKDEGFTEYDPEVDPRIFNSFTAAAFRVLHVTIQRDMKMIENNGTESTVVLSETFNKPHVVYKEPGNYDAFLLGMNVQRCRASWRFFNEDITNKLFKGNRLFGSDIGSLDLQRGQDHGLPSFSEVLEAIFDVTVEEFEDLEPFIARKFLKMLRKLYKSPNKIELFAGLVLESRIKNTRVGPVLRVLIGEQFLRLKYGDRFWYEHKGQFTAEQLKEIRKITPARLVCTGAHKLSFSTKNPFVVASETHNPFIQCDSVPDIDYSKWKETQ